jgi:hypothetical protein
MDIISKKFSWRRRIRRRKARPLAYDAGRDLRGNVDAWMKLDGGGRMPCDAGCSPLLAGWMKEEEKSKVEVLDLK